MRISRDSILKSILILALYMGTASVSLNVTIDSGAFHLRDASPRSSHPSYLYGNCDRPFVFRALPAILIRTACQLTPDGVKEKIVSAWASAERFQSMNLWHGYVEGYEVEYLYTMLLIYISFIGIAFVLRLLLKTFYDASDLTLTLAPVAAIISLPILVSYFTYDYPSLLLFTLGFLLMARRRWVPFYVVFALACLSKETAVLLPFIFLVDARRRGWKWPFVLHLAAQMAVWTTTFVILRMIYGDQPGAFMETHLLDYNLPHLLNLSNYVRFNSIFLPSGLNVFMLAILGFLVVHNWRQKPAFLRSALSMLVPLVGLTLFFGIIDELRDYYESVPVIFALGLHSVAKLFGLPLGVREVP